MLKVEVFMPSRRRD